MTFSSIYLYPTDSIGANILPEEYSDSQNVSKLSQNISWMELLVIDSISSSTIVPCVIYSHLLGIVKHLATNTDQGYGETLSKVQ